MRWIVPLVLATAACSHAPSTNAPPAWSGIQDPASLLAGVPGEAMAVGMIELPDDLGGLAGTFLDEPSTASLRDELDDLMKHKLGVSAKGVRKATFFVVPGDKFAIIVHGVTGKLDPQLTLAAHGPTAVQRGDDLLFGDPEAITAATDVLAAKRPGLDTAPAGAKLRALVVKEAPGALVAFALVTPTDGSDEAKEMAAVGVEAAAFTIRPTGVRAVILGSDANLQKLAGMINSGIDAARDMMDGEQRRATAGNDLAEAMGATIGTHYARYYSEKVRPKLEAGQMVMQLDMPYGAAAVPLLGVMSAVAIPAFMKYTHKAKATEAAVNLKMIYNGAQMAYADDARFPKGHVGPTPPLGTCCHGDSKQCQPDPTLWTDPTWQALHFTMSDPHRYSYEYQSNADGTQFTVSAYGDLNCDGIYSTFEMVGGVNPDGTMTGASHIYKNNELE